MFGQIRVLRALALTLIALSAAGLVYGQAGLGRIVGTITDPSGAVVPAAKVQVTNDATAQTRDTVTNTQGYFVVPALRPSTYTVIVEAAGFSTLTSKGHILQADQSLTVNLAVALQQTSATISVEAAAIQVNTTTATNSEVVEQRRVTDLPLNGRNAASLLTIVAGAIPSPANDVDQGQTKTFPAVVTVSTNGSRQNQVNFRLDGATNTDIYTNVNQPFPFPDALQEFSVQTANYPARYGGNAGGVVNVITKAGGNEFHGGLFYFNRNAVFNARNFFASTKDQLKRNQFGGTIGGPVTIPGIYDGKNKTFFFFGLQGTRIRNLASSNNAWVATTGNVQGDFSNLLNASDPTNPYGRVVTIKDPNTGELFPGNLIPQSRLDPAAVKLFNYLPTVSSGSSHFFWTQPLKQNFWEYVIRIDHQFSEKDRMHGRYFSDKFENQAFLDPANYLNNAAFARVRAQNYLLSETHLFTPNLLNELRLSYSREHASRGPAEGSVGLADLGVNIYQPPGVKIIEGVNVSGYFNLAQTDPAAFIRNQYSLSDDVSWVKGKHSIGFGVSVLRGQVLIRNTFRNYGSYTFVTTKTNDALAALMLGNVRTFNQGHGEYKDNLLTTFSMYVQDDIHLTRKLTLNLGLRWDPFVPWNETKNRTQVFSMSAYLAGTKSRVYTNAPAGLLFPGDDIPDAGLNTAYKNFAPRVGFAYDVTGDGKTSIRSGFGMFFDSFQAGTMNNRSVSLTPYSPQIALTDPQGVFSNPYAGTVNPFPAQFPPPSDAAFPPPVLSVTYDPSNDYTAITPVIYNWNLMVERQLPADWLIRAGYVGSHTSHLMESLEMNPAAPGSGSTDSRRIFKGFGSISQISMDINSSFHSLQLTAQKRFSRNFSVLANYTWSKSIDTLPYPQGIAGPGSNGSPVRWYLPGRHEYDRGPSEFDRRHRFVVSYVWDLPKLTQASPILRAAVGGWQWTGIISYYSGAPLTVLSGNDIMQSGLGTDRPDYVGGEVYNKTGACPSRCIGFLNTSAFAQPAALTLGNLGKGTFIGPDNATWDTGVFKSFPLRSEQVQLQFRAEFFNLLNRGNYQNPNTTLSNAAFGRITAANDPRIGQLGLKLLF